MGIECERKFLVTGLGYRSGVPHRIRQAYLSLDPGRTVRVRLTEAGAFLTIKGPGLGVRPEFDYQIPADDAEQMLRALCIRPAIEKTRYTVPVGPFIFEVDEFAGDNAGLTVAEIELTAHDQEFTRPEWLGMEVTDDPRYSNASLVQRPYRSWRT